MKEELQTALADIILSALETADAAKDFVLQEVPQVVEQLLMWKQVESLVYFSVEVAGLLLSILAAVLIYKFVTKKDNDIESVVKARMRELTQMGYSKRSLAQDRELKSLELGHNHEYYPLLFAPAGTSVFFIVTMFNTLDWLQILIAPKLYLLEYAAELVK